MKINRYKCVNTDHISAKNAESRQSLARQLCKAAKDENDILGSKYDFLMVVFYKGLDTKA